MLRSRAAGKVHGSFFMCFMKKPTRQQRVELERLARQGDVEASNILRHYFHVKVYTDEEVSLLNTIVNQRPEEDEEPTLDVRSRGKVVMLPDYDGNLKEATLNWIQHLKGDYYVAGLTYTDSPRDEGHTEWMLKIDKEKGFVPMFCTLYWESGR